LSPATLGLYGINRLILFSPEKTRELKKSEYFDEIIGFHNGNLRELPLPIVYPKSDRGIAFWIEELVMSLMRYNVKLITDCTVERISRQGGNIRTISLSGGATLDLDFLVWTIPPSIALKAASREFSHPKLNFRTTTLFHFIFPEDSIKKKQMYLWVWDKDFKTFRITLYNNIYDNRFNGESGLTVECLTSFEEAQEIDTKKILFELTNLGVIQNIPPTVARKIVLPNTFPIISQDYEYGVGEAAREFENTFSNACLVGKGSGRYWFTRDLLVHAFDKLCPRRHDQRR
jgi:protoporphyrinogen oxidase